MDVAFMNTSDADTVVERMAQAAFDEIENTPGSTPPERRVEWLNLHESKRGHYRRIMRAALATSKPGDHLPGGLVCVLEEPTDAMARAAIDARAPYVGPDRTVIDVIEMESDKATYRAMISSLETDEGNRC